MTRDAKHDDDTAPKIEVTPEMIEAGVRVLYDLPKLLGPSPEELGDAVKRTFLAMLQVQLEPRHAILKRDPEVP